MEHFDKAKALLDYDRAIQPKLAEICAPLKLLGISNFSYMKTTKDKRYFRIGNYAPYTDLFFKLELYNHPVAHRGFTSDDTFIQEPQTRMFLWNMDNKVPNHLRLSVNMWNGITIYYTNKDHIEAYALGGTPEDTNLPNFLINNVDVLNRFFCYFKNAGKELIDTTDQNRTIEIKFNERLDSSYLTDQQKLEEFLKRVSTNKYFLSNGKEDFLLSLREMECLVHKNQGLSAKEMARIMGISYRTVESYFENIKIKSGLGNIAQVLAICRGEGLL